MEESEKKENMNIHQQTKEETEKIIKAILDDGIRNDNVDYLYKIIDIHKDIANEEYWKEKEDNMRYMYGRGSYGEEYGESSYGRRGVPGTGRRYREGGSYGRRGVPGTGRGRYRGHEMLEDAMEEYGNYSEGKEMYQRGNYGAKEDSMKSLKYMLESVVCFFDMLKEDATSQDEVELIKKYAREISEM